METMESKKNNQIKYYLIKIIMSNIKMSKLEKTISILKDLIQFDTTSCNSNLPIMDYIKDYLKDFGIESTFIKNEEGHKLTYSLLLVQWIRLE